MVSRNEVANYIDPLNPQVRKLAAATHKVLDVKDCRRESVATRVTRHHG